MKLHFIFPVFLFLNWSLPYSFAQEGNLDEVQTEEQTDYYKKWLDEDVVYIISPEEREVFSKLVSPEEKDNFIEQFWHRRDPDLLTGQNEFKEEHYRRLAYANEHFKSGIEGWKTDRGRIYIIHGPPDQREAYPTGGNYERQPHEGGGFTNVYPFERWWYRHLEGVGSDIEMEFVDPRMSNEYYLAVNPEEKDALLHVPGGGPTWAEDFGLRSKADRPYFVSNYGEPYPWMNYRAKDDPMRRYEQYFDVQRPTPIKYKDLKEMVEVNLSYSDLPFSLRKDYVRINDSQVLVPVTLQLNNHDLSMADANGQSMVKLVVYGLVTSLTGHIITEFEDEVSTSYTAEELSSGLFERSMYQRILPLQTGMRYKLDIVVKDMNSQKIGIQRHALVPPRPGNDLEASSLILSGFIRQLQEIPDEEQMFVLGDIWIRPSVDHEFLASDPLGIYLQLYNLDLDQTTFRPSVNLTFRILEDGKTVREIVEEQGESVYFFSGQRAIVIKGLSLEGLAPGKYQLEVRVVDLIGQENLLASSPFEVIQSRQELAQNP